MTKTPFQTFIDLVALDQDIIALQKECEHVSQLLMQTSDAKKSLYDHLALLKHQLLQAKKTVDSLELEMKSLDEQEIKKKKLLDQVSNLKEYNSVKFELDALHEDQQNKEQQVVAAWHKLESVQHEIDTYIKSLDEKAHSYDENLQTYTQQHQQCIQQVKEKKEKRPEQEKGIPSEWLEKYMIMRERVPNPVIPLEDEICTACFHNATKQDVATIQRGALVQCKGCYRLLYAPSRVNHA